MIFEDALKIAIEKRKDINAGIEVEDAFFFFKADDAPSYGGNGRIAILKKDGRAVNMAYYISITQRTGGYEIYYKKCEDGSWQKTKVVGQE